MKIQPIKTRIFQEGESLAGFVAEHIKKIKENSVLVVTSKIVALSEKRTAIIKNEHEKETIIKKESELAIPTKHIWLTIKDGIPMPAAGIDESNANGKIILLPKDSFFRATALRRALKKKFKIKNLGVLITDSRTMPLRAGITGVALGYSGFRGIREYRGTPDIFGRKLEFSRTDVADSLATAAVLIMGEGREQIPIAIIEDSPTEFCDKINKRELHIDIEDDMYQPLFSNLPQKNK